LGLFVRIHGLGDPSLWYDEGGTLWYGLGDLHRWISDTHPPLYYAFVHFWLQFGTSEYWLRLSSVIPGVATIPLVYSLGKKLFGANSGLLAAAFLALMAFHVGYSQQARMYALFAFFYTSAIWALVSAAHEEKRRHWLTYAISIVLLAYIQGIGILYVAIVAAMFPLISTRPLKLSSWKPFLLANAVAVLSYLPWLWTLRAAHDRTNFLNWLSRPRWYVIPKTLGAFLSQYFPIYSLPLGKFGIRPLHIILFAILAAPGLLLCAIGIRRILSNREWRFGAVALSALALPLLCVYFISILFKPIYIDRVVLPAAIGLVLIIGASVHGSGKSTKMVYFLIACGLLVSGANTYWFPANKEIEDFRTLSKDLQHQVKPGEPILFVVDSGVPQFIVKFYDPDGNLDRSRMFDFLSVLANCHQHMDQCPAGALDVFSRSSRAWLVTGHDAVISDDARRWLNQHFDIISAKGYKGSVVLAEARTAGF
jgi:mannosyltransferase